MANLWINYLQMKTEITLFPRIITGGDYLFFSTKRGRIFEGGDYFKYCSLEAGPDSCRFDIGRFRAKPTNYQRRPHRSDTFAYRSTHNNLFLPHATRNAQVKKDIERTISTQRYIGMRLKLVNTRLKL